MPKIFGTWALTMPGPLSSTTTRKRPSPFVSSAFCFMASRPRSCTSTRSSGRMPASSQASSELSTASLMVVRSAFEGLSKPSRWRFLAKNSETEISRCFEASDSAVTRGAFADTRGAGGEASSGVGSTAAGGDSGAWVLVAFGPLAAALGASAANRSSCGFSLLRPVFAPGFCLPFCFATSLPRMTAPRGPAGPRKRCSLASHAGRPREVRSTTRLARPERIRWRA